MLGPFLGGLISHCFWKSCGRGRESAPGRTAVAGGASLKTASLRLVGKRLFASLLSLRLVDEFYESTLVLECATLQTRSELLINIGMLPPSVGVYEIV